MTNLGWTLSSVFAGITLLGIGSVGAAEPSTGWKAGVARVHTTPTAPVRMAGYASRTSPSQGVAHPLAAKALALSDPNGTKVIIVSCDIISFRRPFTTRVTDRVKVKHGLPRENIVLFASHNHAGPSLAEPPDPVPTREPNIRRPREQYRIHAKPRR